MGRVMGRDDGQAQAPVRCPERHPAAWRAPCGCVAPPSDPGGRGTWRQAGPASLPWVPTTRLWTRDASGDRPRPPALCQSENHWKLGVSFIFPGVDLMVSCGIVSVSCSETEVYFAASESLSLNPLMTPVQK